MVLSEGGFSLFVSCLDFEIEWMNFVLSSSRMGPCPSDSCDFNDPRLLKNIEDQHVSVPLPSRTKSGLRVTVLCDICWPALLQVLADNHSCSEFVSETALSCPEDSISRPEWWPVWGRTFTTITSQRFVSCNYKWRQSFHFLTTGSPIITQKLTLIKNCLAYSWGLLLTGSYI